MFYNEYIVIHPNGHDRDYAEAYIDNYINSNATCKDASYDFRTYMTKTLIYRGFLELNSETIARLYKDPIEKIFSESFRKIFLYDTQRTLSKIYKDVDCVKAMNIIGNYDLLSTMITPITAKFFPLIESFSITDEDLFNMVDISNKKPVGEDDLDSGEYTDEELKSIKTTVIEKNIDNKFVELSHKLIKIIKNVFETYSITEIIDAASIHSEKYTRAMVANIYTKLFELMQLIVYRVSINDNLKPFITDENKSTVMKIIEGCTKRLSESETVMNNMDIEKYFSDVVLEGIFGKDTEFLTSINDHYKIYDPVVNSQTLVSSNPSKAVVVTNFTENLINMRSIYEEANENEESIRRMFGYFVYSTVTLIQSIFYNAFLLDDKAGMNSNAASILGNIVPEYKSIMLADTLKGFFKTFNKDL